MAKLTLNAAKKAVGVGQLVIKTIKFRGADGEECEGEIFVKALSAHEVEHITDVLKLGKDEKWTLIQYRAAMLYQAVFEGKDKPFFPTLEDVGTVSHEIQAAMYAAVDEVVNFSGKHWISNKATNSGANSSSTELAEEQ